MIQVEIITEISTHELQKEINEWFTNHPNIELIDIKYQAVGYGLDDCYEFFSAMIIYKK